MLYVSKTLYSLLYIACYISSMSNLKKVKLYKVYKNAKQLLTPKGLKNQVLVFGFEIFMILSNQQNLSKTAFF